MPLLTRRTGDAVDSCYSVLPGGFGLQWEPTGCPIRDSEVGAPPHGIRAPMSSTNLLAWSDSNGRLRPRTFQPSLRMSVAGRQAAATSSRPRMAWFWVTRWLGRGRISDHSKSLRVRNPRESCHGPPGTIHGGVAMRSTSAELIRVRQQVRQDSIASRQSSR